MRYFRKGVEIVKLLKYEIRSCELTLISADYGYESFLSDDFRHPWRIHLAPTFSLCDEKIDFFFLLFYSCETF